MPEGIRLLGTLCLSTVLHQSTVSKGHSSKNTGHCMWSAHGFLFSQGKSVYFNFLPGGTLCLSNLFRKKTVPGSWICCSFASVTQTEARSPHWAVLFVLQFPGHTQQIAPHSWKVKKMILQAISLYAWWWYFATLTLVSIKVRSAASL